MEGMCLVVHTVYQKLERWIKAFLIGSSIRSVQDPYRALTLLEISYSDVLVAVNIKNIQLYK